MKTFLRPFLLSATLAAGLCTAPLHAEEEPSPAEQLIALTGFSQTAKDGAKAVFSPFLARIRAQGLPEEAIGEISAAADRFFDKTFDDPALLTDMAAVYSEAFTNDEILQLLAFYKTPIGKKAIQTLPQVMAEGARIGQQYAEKNQAGFQQELQAIFEKHEPGSVEPE